MSVQRMRRRLPSLAFSGLVLLGCLAEGGAQGASLGCGSLGPSAPRDALLRAHLFTPYVAEAALRFGLPERWIWAVMRAESGGNPRAVSAAGAMGLMQLMPATWAALTARYALGPDPFDVRANILGGAAYLREMLDRYRDPATALAAYNAGPGRVDVWRSAGRPLPTETVAYVARIAPSVGASGIASPAVAPPSWRDAALFSQRETTSSGGVSSVSAPAVAALSSDASSGRGSSASRDVLRPTNLLFVALSGRVRR